MPLPRAICAVLTELPGDRSAPEVGGRDELRRRRSGGSRDTRGASQIHMTREMLLFHAMRGVGINELLKVTAKNCQKNAPFCVLIAQPSVAS